MDRQPQFAEGVSDAANQLRWTWEPNDPFGRTAPNENPGNVGNFQYNLRFPGQYFDVETGLGAAWLTRRALPALAASRGRIVVNSSLAGITGVSTRTGYAASKHAMFGFFDSLRIELADCGVSVTVIAPDFVRSEIHRRAIGSDGKPLGTSPMLGKKIMTAESCARLIVEAALKRRRLVFTSVRGCAMPWLKLLAPSLVDRLAARAIRRRS